MIPLKEYCELFEEDYQKMYVNIYGYEKQGIMPIFAKRVGSTYYVDPDKIDYYTELEYTAWSFATSKLYWFLTEWMNLSHSEIGRRMSLLSPNYKKENSWQVFISNRLFSIPETKIYSPRSTMIQEFAIYGMNIVIDHFVSKGYKKDFDWDKHIENTLWANNYKEAM